MFYRRVVVTFTILAFHALTAFTSPIDKLFQSATLDTEELVITPIGLIPKSSVHLVPKGAGIHRTPTRVQVISTDGTILHSEDTIQTTSIHVKAPDAGEPTPTQANTPRALQTGNVCFAVWQDNTGSPISSFTATWEVPRPPTNFDGQSFFYFSSLQPAESSTDILQPALQFGVSAAGGGDFYGLVSWFFTGTTVFHSQLTEIGTFQIVETIMSISSNTGTSFNWGLGFVGFPNSGLAITTSDEFLFAFQGLQIVSATSINDLSIAQVDFVDISIETLAGTPQENLQWKTTNDQPDGPITMTVVSESPTEGELILTVP